MESTTSSNAGQQASINSPERKPRYIGALVLIVVGVLLLGENLFPDFRFWDYWPVILVAIGFGLLWKSRRPN